MNSTKKYSNLLEKLGMTDEERSIYIALLNHPYMTISELARETGYHRPSVYRAIASLESEGYIEKSLLEGKRYYYHVTSPLRLQEKLDELTHIAMRLIPEMEAVHQKHHSAPVFSMMEGINGIRRIHDDIIQTLPIGGEYLCYSASKEGEEMLGLYVSEGYKRKTKLKELSRKLIVNAREKESNDSYRDVAIIPHSFDTFNDEITKIVYGTKVAVIDYNSHMGWIIDNPQFAQYEEKLFRLLFKLLQKP